MKKTVAVLLLILVLAVLTGCKGKENEHINFGMLIPTSTRTVSVEHAVCGKITSYTAEKQKIEGIENWLSSLKCERRSFEHGNEPSDCEGGECYMFTTEKSSFSYVKNGENDCYLHIKDGWYFVKNPSDPPKFDLLSTEENAVLKNEHDNAKAVFVLDKLYISTEAVSTRKGRCAVMDGEITAMAPEGEVPSKNGESNFGVGYDYQISGVNSIDVFIDGKPIVFRCYDNEGKVWVSRTGETEEILLSKDDEARVKLLFAEAGWQEGSADGSYDCILGGMDDGEILYAFDGRLFWEKIGKNCVLSLEEKDVLDRILELYISLEAE